MAEPHSTTAGVLAGASIGLTGTVMGAQIDALLMGMVAAVLMSFWLPSINDRMRAASAVAMSSLLAGYGSPVAAGWIATAQAGFHDDVALRMFIAVLIGGICPTLLPMALDRARAFLQGGSKA